MSQLRALLGFVTLNPTYIFLRCCHEMRNPTSADFGTDSQKCLLLIRPAVL
ncbi:hypothetical protein D1AOALGA4SA_10564 [Olavius algarvensis Delta 1 endosymbiont]|nr:hypothetical protein D1AOALGA4SA_10564 [Olavius algarvensis Delta 1 endosymbiont]